MVAYTIVHVNSEQGQTVISQHIIELPVNICINFNIGVKFHLIKLGVRKDIPSHPNYLVWEEPPRCPPPPVPTPM